MWFISVIWGNFIYDKSIKELTAGNFFIGKNELSKQIETGRYQVIDWKIRLMETGVNKSQDQRNE